MEISHNIRELRKARSLTQEQLAEAMGVSGAAVSKWENGQCAPDLSLLTALADFFEVSVDRLLGHTLRANRLEAMLQELESLADRRESEAATALAEDILRCYPNSYEAVDGCAQAYYTLHSRGLDRKYMERCNELTHRLFVLAQGEPEAKRLERMYRLGNQYELLEDWEQALRCYTDSNVNRINDRHIAKCHLKMGQTEQALTMLSEAILDAIFTLFHDAATLANIWDERGEPEKACAATTWAADAIEATGYGAILRVILYTLSASYWKQTGHMEQAKAFAQKADEIAQSCDETQAETLPFLQPKRSRPITTNFDNAKDMLSL